MMENLVTDMFDCVDAKGVDGLSKEALEYYMPTLAVALRDENDPTFSTLQKSKAMEYIVSALSAASYAPGARRFWRIFGGFRSTARNVRKTFVHPLCKKYSVSVDHTLEEKLLSEMDGYRPQRG